MYKGGFINYVLGFLVMSIYYCCFVNYFIIDQSNFFKMGQVAVCFFESDFYDYLIVRYDWVFEVCFVNISEVVQFIWFQFFYVFKCQNICCLCYCFQNQYIWENWFFREMVLEEWFIDRDIFYCVQKMIFFKIQYVIYQ